MGKCKQMRKHTCMFTILASSWLCNYSRTPLQFYRLENSARTTEIPMSGKAVKSHGWPNREKYIQNGQFRTFCCSRVVFQFWYYSVFNIDSTGLVFIKFRHRAKWRTDTRQLGRDKPDNQKPKQKEGWQSRFGRTFARSSCKVGVFVDNLEDTEMPVPALISQDSDSQRPTKVVSKSRKHNIFIHFPKNRSCEVCLRTKITRVPCRRRTDEAAHRAEKFCDLITADHNVHNEEGESQNNHRYKIWPSNGLNLFRAKQKLLKVVTEVKTDNALAISKSYDELSWSHRTSTSHRFETNDIEERAVRRVKEGTSAVLLQYELNEKW